MWRSELVASLTVEDVCNLNAVVKQAKQEAEMVIRIQPLQRMRFGVVSDASWGNAGFHSQGGHIIMSHEKELHETGVAKANVIAWRSGKLQRVVKSTLAAETQSLSRGIGDLLWTMVVHEEFTDGRFDLRHWPERLGASEVVAMASDQSDHVLQGSLAVVDAKSLFDQLSKQTTGGSDRRTAIEVQIIREDLASLGGRIRWVDHLAMIADGLTKIRGSNVALYRMLRTGRFQVQAETSLMEDREAARRDGQTNTQLRRTGIKDKGRDVILEGSHEHP